MIPLDIGMVSLAIAAIGSVGTLAGIHFKAMGRLNHISDTQQRIAETCTKLADIQGQMMIEMQKMIHDHEQQTQRLNDMWSTMHNRERRN